MRFTSAHESFLGFPTFSRQRFLSWFSTCAHANDSFLGFPLALVNDSFLVPACSREGLLSWVSHLLSRERFLALANDSLLGFPTCFLAKDSFLGFPLDFSRTIPFLLSPTTPCLVFELLFASFTKIEAGWVWEISFLFSWNGLFARQNE